MADRPIPSLALALAAAASAWLRLDEHEAEFAGRFVPAVAALDEADREYRRAVETALPPHEARATLSAMAAFRDRVHAVRERARREIGDLYQRFNRAYGAFDPLDPYLPATTGLSHADGTRAATLADGARSEVAVLRARANQDVVAGLQAAQVDALVAAKRRRREAFDTALGRALETAVAPVATLGAAELEKTRSELVRLADGWY
jgi:hypothetical protein